MIAIIFLITCAALPWTYKTYHQQNQRSAQRNNKTVKRTPTICTSLDPAVVLDLVAAGLNSGASIPLILKSLGESGADPRFHTVSRGLMVGLEWDQAWEQGPPGCAALAQALAPAWKEGVAPNSLLARASANVRRDRTRRARISAATLGVKLVLPLGLCYLPAFIFLGIVPVIASGASSLFTLGH